jgi:SAM-dependent methyltransferase
LSQVQRHYDDLLAKHYSWMSGMAFADKVAEQSVLLTELGIATDSGGLAVDLGCGPGYQAIALKEIGYARVLALDISQALLDELAAARQDQGIEPVLADMRAFRALTGDNAAEAIVCMGDTLTHLESPQDVARLFADAQAALKPGGSLVLTFRDYSQELVDTDRFIPVHADQDRIMVCALTYEPEHVVVTDLVHVRAAQGWRLDKSSYRKLRLAPPILAGQLRDFGFELAIDCPVGRMRALVARKPHA